MKKLFFVFIFVFTFSFLFAEGAMEDTEAPPFPAHVPFAGEYLSTYNYLTTGVQEEFAEITIKTGMLEDENAQKAEFVKGYTLLTERYEREISKIEEFAERMVTGRFMTYPEKEQFVESMRNCNILLFITGAMMSAMMGENFNFAFTE